ncbi:MAG: hypothetical protein EA377_07305 [Phycisphaerales bacterium]|nr:MAG: hypothetical protein EA377_07305 [Phycisphaerales bacterium]
MTTSPSTLASKRRGLSDRERYNLVTDTVAGPNLRWRDNAYQAIAILVVTIISVVIVSVLAQNVFAGLILGTFAGLSVGLIVTSIFLMVYRGYRHMRGKHD